MKIKVFKESVLLKEYDIKKDSFILGRTESSDICIPEDSVSRKHIEFKVKNDETVEFFKKAKFAMITKDGEDMEKGDLRDGEKLEVGGLTIVLCVKETPVEAEISKSEAEAEPKPKAKSKKAHDFDFFTMSADPKNLKDDNAAVLEIPEDQPVVSDKKDEKKDATVDKKDDKKSDKKEEKVDDKKSALKKEEKAPAPDATIVGPSYLLYQLIAISGPHKDKVFTLDKDVMIAGRGKKVEISLIDDLVSREHSRFYRQGMDYYVVDLDSSNGTKVNGKKAVAPVLLNSGDIVEIGASILRFMVVNPQVQNIHGVKELTGFIEPGHAAVEKVAPMPSDTKIRKIEESYGFEQEGAQKPKKSLLLPIIIMIAVTTMVAYFVMGQKKEPAPAAGNTNNNNAPAPVLQEEQVPEVKCDEVGSFCQQPLAVQKQLLAEYEVAVRLLKNFQFELAEDRAQQILAKVPDWAKAKEVLDVASAEKEKLLAQKKEEEDAVIRKELEKKIAVYLKEAEALMKKEKYDEVKEIIAKIFEIDPNNQPAKDMADKIEGVSAKRMKLAGDRAKYLVTLNKYERVLEEGKKYYSAKEYRKAIEVFQKCISFPPTNAEKINSIKDECKKLSNESANLLKEAVTPELSGGIEAYTNGRYKEAIEAYKRVVKMDYKNKEAKEGINKAKEALDEEAREIFARAAIAESVSDFTTACPLYNRVLEISLQGSKYYESAAAKAKTRCGTKL